MARVTRINLLTVSVILISIGIVMIYSTSCIYAWEHYKDSLYFLKRHLSFVVIGTVASFFMMMADLKKLRPYTKIMVLISLGLLLLVMVPGLGTEVSGARRWFRFKFISFQPTGLASMSVIFYVADFIARKRADIKTFSRGFLPPISILGAIAMLILVQPDLGSTMALVIVVFVMLYVAGVKIRYLTGIVLTGLPALYLLIFSVPYRRMRVLAFLNPWLDPKGSGFQIIQSQLALGSGGLFGVGLGHSKQKLFYLPAAHTDFIFSIIGEELGLVGTLGVIVLFMIFIQQGLKIIKNTHDTFSYFLALGLVLMISLRAIINIGVSCGMFPTKGLPLPFISYGGSSFIFDMVSVAILLNIAARSGEYA